MSDFLFYKKVLIILCLVLAVITGYLKLANPNKQIGMVNITSIVNEFLNNKTNQELPAKVIQQKVNEFSQKLQKIIVAITREKNLVLVPSEVVLAGAKDFTPLVKEKLNLQ